MSVNLNWYLVMDSEDDPVPETYDANIAVTAADLFLYHFDSDTETIVETLTQTAPASRLYVSCRWHPSGDYLAICNVSNASNDAKTEIYSWDGAALTYISEVQPVANNGHILSFSLDGNYAAIATNNDGNQIYFYTFAAGVLTPIAGQPDITPGNSSRWAEWNSDGHVLLTGGHVPYYYERSGSVFTGQTYADPSSFYGDNGPAWSPDSQFVAMCNNRPAAELLIYESGVLIEQLDTPTGAGPVAFTEDGTMLATGNGITPYVTFFDVPAFDPVSFTGDALPGAATYMWWVGDYLVVSHTGAPYFTVMRHDGGGTFVTLADSVDLPTGNPSYMHAIRVPA
jgi:WD40 repeat protein